MSAAEKIPEVSLELIQKYSGSGPRYTSYPTAVEFRSEFGNEEWKQAIADDLAGKSLAGKSQGESSAALSLYVHLPFCHSLCYFCACNKVITQDQSVVGPYVQALQKEIRSYAEFLGPNHQVEQIHWGGGTPNYLTPAEMESVHVACLEAFPNLVVDADISVEIDPRTTSREHLQKLAALGFNRLSLGVQDFTPEVQETINRIQPYELTHRVCEEAREEGFKSLNIDLIYGLPNQTESGFGKTVEKVLEIRPERIALYGYAHVTWLKKVQKALERAHLPTPVERIQIFRRALQMFSDAGYEYIGMDHFALPNDSLAQALRHGKLNRNFMGYTTHNGARILGFGASAISTLPQAFAQNVKDVALYQKRIAGEDFAIERGLRRSAEDCLRGDIIETLLCCGEVDIQRFESFWHVDFATKFADGISTLRECAADGLVIVDSQCVRLTPLGRIFARNVAMAFDEYLPAHRAAAKPVFSQAV